MTENISIFDTTCKTAMTASQEYQEEDMTALAESFLAFTVAIAINTYVTPGVIIIGLVGNTLSFLVMLQSANRKLSSCAYMAALAVSDNMSLLIAGSLIIASNLPIPILTDTLCGIAAMSGQSFILSGVAIVVSMTLDRCLAVQFPLKSAIWCTVKRAKLTTAVIVIVSGLYNIPYLLYSTAIQQGKQCGGLSVKNKFTTIYTWISVAINSVIPFILLFVFNILIIRSVLKRKKFFIQDQSRQSVNTVLTHDDYNSSHTNKQGGNNHGITPHSKESSLRERQLMIMLILVSFALLVLTLPMYARYIVFVLVDFTKTPHDYANYLLIYHSTRTLFFSNNASNFFLYCIGGSKFRQDLSSVFSFRHCKYVLGKNRSTI